MNDGRGRFTQTMIWGSTNADFGSSWISTADMDGDGDPDILYSNGDAFDYAPANSRPWQGVQWLEFDPDNPDVVGKLARMLRTVGRSGEALDLFARYSRMVPDDFQALGEIGSSLSNLGRFDEAEPFLRRAHQQLDDALTHYNLGALLSATGRLDKAVVEYQHALNRDPSDPDARSNLAAELVKQGKLGRATEELTRVLEIDPDNANAHTNLGLVLAQQGHMVGAAQEFQTALRLNPGLAQAAEALRQLGMRN